MPIKSREQFNEDLYYSGGDVTKMPIIGSITTNAIGPFDEADYDIVEIIETEDGKRVYVCNRWYKEYKRIPQIIHSDLVKEYVPLSDI